MATEADDVPDPTSVMKREVEGKDMTSELSNITVSEGPQEEKKKIESWLSQPPEIIEFLGKTESEEVGDDDEVANMNVINKGNGESVEGDVFSKSLSVADEKSERFTEHNRMTLEGEESKASVDSVGIEMDPETIRPTIDIEDLKNKHGSSLLDAPVEETTSEKAGPAVEECVEENTSISSKEASQEAVELAEKMNDSTSNEDVFFHEVDNLETLGKESESGMKAIVKESQHEAEHKNEILENIATTASDQSKTSMLDEIQDTKADVSSGQPLECPEDNVVAEEQEKTETSPQEEQSGHSHMQRTEREAPADPKDIETEGATKDAETITDIEEQRPVGSPEEIIGEERKDETVISYDIDKNEIQEVNNIATVDLDEKTGSAELEIPNNSGSESWITHPPIEEEVQVGGDKEDEVSMSESGDSHEAIQIPNEEEKHVNETPEATKSPESTILEHTATEVTSTSEMDINTEKGCELKYEEALKEINAEDNMEEESEEQREKVSDTEVLEQRKSDDNERSTIEEDIPVKNETPLCSGEEEYRQDQEEEVGSKSFLEEIRETDSGDQSHITSDEINTLNEQIINQEVCEDTKIVDRAEDREKEMKNDENTVIDFSAEPMGESTIKCSEGNEAEAKKHMAEASEQYDTCGESAALEESAITDLPSSHVQEEEVEESLTENRREAMISDKEVSNSNIECIERDFEATHSTKESTGKDLKDEEEANEGLNAQSIIGSSEEETAQESNSNLVQSSSVPEIIEKEVNRELLEKEESKDTMEVEEARLTEAEAENPIRVDNSNQMSESKDQVTTETSEMRPNDIDIIAESSEISIVGDKNMEIPTERMDGADEPTEKTQPDGKSETCDELSKPEDQGEIATFETSSDYMPQQELLESSTMPLEAPNLVTEVSETTGEAPDKEKTLSDKEETPLVAETTEEHIAEKEDESLIEEKDANMVPIDIGKESTIDDSLHAPLELNSGESRTESDEELLKGVNAGERSSYKEVETEKSVYEQAVNEASQGIEVGGGRIETEKTIQEQADSAMHFEGSSKESVEMEKGTVEFESEAHSCGSEASETPTISAQTEKKIDVEDKELASELPNVTVNKVPSQEKSDTESWLSQPHETLEILETECMQVAPNVEVGNVKVVDKGNLGTTETESFLKSTTVDDGKLSGFQEEQEKVKMIKVDNGITEASYGQDGGVRIQSPELTEGSSRDVEIPNEVLNEENMETITSTETTSVEQDLKETSFEGEDKKSNALEMDPEAIQPSTDIEEEENKVKEMPCHGVKDFCISTETDEPTESNVGATDRLGSLLAAEPIEETSSTNAGPDVCKNPEENSSMACEDESQETGTLSERIKDDASIEDEVQNQNLESSFVKKVEDLEISKEESETGMKDIDKEKQKEAENENKTLDNTATADRSLSTEGEDVENTEIKSQISDMQPEESMTRESEYVTPPEGLTMECEPEVIGVPGEHSVVVEEQESTETSKHEEHSEHSLKENAEPAKENVGSPTVVASEEFETTSLNDCTETITKIEEENPVGNPEEILGERENEINNREIPEAESLSALDLDKNIRSAEIKIPDNGSEEVCVTHPPMEETVLEGGEKQVSMLESVDQVHKASASEFPKDEEKHANDSNEASKSPDSECSISEQTSAEGEVNIETTRSVKEIPVGSQEEIYGQPRTDETMTADDINNKETPEAENTVDLYGTPPSVEETFLEEGEKKNDVSVLESGNPVSEASEVPREEEKNSNDTYEATKSPEINILEQASNEGALNMEATSTRSAADITLEKESELIPEDELKELKSEENKEVTEEKEKAAVAEFQVPTKSDDEENSTIKEESLVENNTLSCTGEGEYHHDQEDEVMSIRSKEASPALDSGEKSCSTSNEIKIIDDQIMNEEASNVHGTAPAISSAEECSIPDLPSLLTGEEKVEERLKEDRGDETKSEIEVSNSTAECVEQTFDAACSTEEREDRTLKHEESITESPSEQTTQEGRNLDITENYSSVPDICEKEAEEEVLEKEDSNVPVAAEETSLNQVEGETVKTVDSSDLVVEEKGLVPTEISEGSNAVARTVETSILGENNDVEFPTAREVATVETSLDDVSEQMLQVSSMQKSEEHNLVSPEVGETTGEAPEKDETHEKAETPLPEETTEDEITEIEDESSHPMKDTNMGSIEKEKERESDNAAVEDREFYTPPEQNIEERTSESDVEPLRSVKSETVEELKSSEKDNSEYETAISGTSEGIETCGGCMDTEKAILEQGDSAKNLEGSSMESEEIDKAPVEFEAETHSSGTSEAKSFSTLKGENINVVEHDETATESMAKDEDNRRFPETNPTDTEEERQDDENQTIASPDKQINRQGIQEGKKEMNEEMQPKFETQEEINGTQDAILTEKVSTETESASERETIKEQNTEEESCTKELHISPAADGTVNEVPTVLESTSESEIIEGQITEEESCTKELHTIKLPDETVDEVRDLDLTSIPSLEATASNKNDEMMRSDIAEDINMESEATQKENETRDAFSTEEVSTDTSSAMNEVTYPDQTAIHSLEATASNKIMEMMESKTAQDLNEKSEASPIAEVLEDETKNIEKTVEVPSLVSEGSEVKMKGEKIEDMESVNDETDIAPTVATDLSSFGEVQLNDEPVKVVDTSSEAESLHTTKTADAGEQELVETSIIVPHFSIQEHENADNENMHAEKSDANAVEVEVTEIPDSVSQTEDQAVKEIHETGTSLNVIDTDTQEIEQQTREVPEALLEPTNEHDDEARDEEIIAGQAEKTEEQLQVPSAGLLSEEQESETTTGIEKGSTNEDAMEEAKMRQAEVSMIREDLETTSEGEGIENQVQGEEKRVQDFTEELDADSSRDNSILTKMSAQEVLETNHGGQDTDEPVKALVTSSDTGSQQTTETSDSTQQELEENSSMESPFPVEEHEKSENISANVDKSDAYDVEEKEFEIHGDVPQGTDQKVQEVQETGASLPVGEAHTNETANQNREAPEGFSEAINQGVEALREDEIIAPAVAMEATNLGEVQLNEHVETLDANSGAKNLDTIKTADASQQSAEFENMKLEDTFIMVSQPPIHEHEEADKENIPPENSEANYVEVEEAKIPDRVPEYQDQAVKEIHETGTSLNVGDSDANEIEKPISEVPEALLEPKSVDTARDDAITSGQILRGEKLQEQLQAPSSGLLSKEEESETTTMIEKGSTDKAVIEETMILQAEIREELETTGVCKENQVPAEEKRVQDWSTVSSTEELDTKSSKDNAMFTKPSSEEVLETNQGSHDTDEHVKALDTSSDTESLRTTQTPDASQQEPEETSSMVSELPVNEYGKVDNKSVTIEKSDTYDAEVKEIDLPGVVPESKDQRVQEIHEVGTSVEETQTNDKETQIREVREALSEDVSQGVETVSGEEIIAPSEVTKVTTLGELQLNDELVEAPDTIKTGDASQEDAQFDSMKHEETSAMVSQLPIHEDEKEESGNRPVEKSDANDVEVEEAEIHDTVPDSEDQAVKEIHEASTSLTAGGADTNEIEKQIRVPEALSEPINPDFDTSRDDEMTPVQTLRAEKTEEQLQVPSSGLFSEEEDGETSTAIEKGTPDKDGTEVSELQEKSGLVFHLPITEVNSANELVEEKSDADEVGLIETKTLDAVSESKDQVFEAIHDIGTIPAAEDTETDKVEEEIKELPEKVPDLGYKGVDAATDGENLNHPVLVGTLEEQIQLSSSSYESTKEDATEVDKSELEEATDKLSKLPTTEHGIHHVGTAIEKSEADKIQVEEAKTSEAISESEGDGFEEIKEIGSSLSVEKTCTDEVKEETKAVPETIFESTYEGAQTAIDVETAINQTLTSQGVEQLQEPKSTTEKPCLQDEGLRELEVSNLELKVQDNQDISAEEENTGLKKGSTDTPLEFEESPIQGSSQEASTDEDIVYSKNSNKDADNLPPPYPTVTELSTEDKGGKSEEASNLEFERNGKVLPESVSVINSLEVPLTSEGIKDIEESPKESTTELGDGENHCEEATEEEEAIEKHTSKEKTTEEMQVSRNFDPVSLGEETATKTNQEDISMAEDYPGERANVIFEASRNEVQHEMVFEESEEAGAVKSTDEAVTADDKGPYQVSVGDEIANVTPPEEAKDGHNIQKIPNESELKSHGDETDSTDAATEAAAQIKESSEAMLVSHEVERAGDNVEETVISKDVKLQNTALTVPPEADAAAEKAPDEQELQTFDDFREPALEGPTHGFTEPYEHKKEIVTTGTIDSESLMDNEKLEHTFLEPGCEGTGGTKDLDLTKKDGSNKKSISSTTATSQETLADEESEKAVDTKQQDFVSDKPTAEPASIPEEGNRFQFEEHTMEKERVEVSALGEKRKLDEAKIQTITAIEDEETQQQNDGLPHIEDSEKEVSNEKVLMNIPEDVQGPEKTSLAIPHEQIASKTDPSESIEGTNPTASKDVPLVKDDAAAKTFSNVEVEDLNAGRDMGSEPEAKGMECAEENRMGEKSEEIPEESQKPAKLSFTDLMQRSTKQNLRVIEDLTEERELMGNKEEPQNATAETVQAEEEEVHEMKDEEEEGDEHKREDSGSDAPVMVEASRDMDVKTAHKKSHHNILSGVGSKVKHSLARVKKAITGKSSHPKPTSPK